MTTKLNPEKPDGGETQKACAKPHVSFENEYLQCVFGEGHKGMHAAKSAFGGTLQWHDNLAPSPQPSAEATEPEEASIWPPSIIDEAEPDEPVAYLYRVREVGKQIVEFAAVDGWRPTDPAKEVIVDKWPLYLRPAPSGETRGIPAWAKSHLPVKDGFTPQEMASCMGFDAMRIARGVKPIHFTVAEVMRWMELMARI